MTKQIFPVSPSGSPGSSPAGSAPGRVLKKQIFPTVTPAPAAEPATGPSFLSRAASFGRAAFSIPRKVGSAVKDWGHQVSSLSDKMSVASQYAYGKRFNPNLRVPESLLTREGPAAPIRRRFGTRLLSDITLGSIPGPEGPPQTTGEKVADVAGSLIGISVPWSAASRAATPLTKLGPVVKALSKLGPVGRRIAAAAIPEGIAGGVVGGAQAAIEGAPPADVLKQTALGVGLGAGIPAATEAVGAGVKAAVKPIFRKVAAAKAAREASDFYGATRRVGKRAAETAAPEIARAAETKPAGTGLFGESTAPKPEPYSVDVGDLTWLDKPTNPAEADMPAIRNRGYERGDRVSFTWADGKQYEGVVQGKAVGGAVEVMARPAEALPPGKGQVGVQPSPAVATTPVRTQEPASIPAPSAPVKTVDLSAVRTGQPATVRVYRGYGRAEEGAAYTVPGSGPVVGKADYFAPDRPTAATYGPNVEEVTVSLRNPLVVDKDEQWWKITRAAGWEFPNPVRFGNPDQMKPDAEAMQAYIKGLGHDGLVVRLTSGTDETKTLDRVFGHDQVISFGPAGINRDIRRAMQARVGQPGEASTSAALEPAASATPEAATAAPGRPYSQVTKRGQIIRQISKDLSKPIYLGHVSQGAAPPGYTARGVFEIWPEVIRTLKRYDLRTIFHEVGHAIDKRLAMSDVGKLTAKQVAELEFLAKPVSAPGYTPDQLAAEGVAEFISIWTNKGEAEARALAPEFAKFFDAMLGQEKGLAEVLRRSQARLSDWYIQSARDRILGSLSVGERSNQTIQTKSKPRAAWDRFKRAILDSFAPLENLSNELGRPMSPTKDPFKLAWLSRGSGAKAEGRIRFGYRNPETLAKETEGLDAALKPIAGKIDDFRAYMAARRAVELESRGIEHGLGKGMYSGDVQATFNSLNTPEFRKAFDALGKEYHAGLMDLVDSGRISKETAARIEALNKDYVPFKRVFEDALNFGQKAGSSKGFADLPKAVHEIKGSSREIIDPLESTIEDIYLFTKLADNNRVGRALADLADNTEGAGWWLSRVDDLGKVPAKENILTVYRNGEAVHYQVRDPDLYRAVLALDGEASSIVLKILSYPASLLRAGATLSPDFIARNPIRDQFSALIYSKYGFVPGVDLIKGIMHAVNQDEVYQLYLESGAGHAALVSLDREYLQGTLRRFLENKNAFVNAFKHPVSTLQDISELMEVGTRLGEFSKAIAKEGTSREGLMKAALAARDITVDFARKGTETGWLNRTIAFFNASLQGTDKMRRAFIEDPRGTTVKATLAITLPSVLLWSVNKDDPWYHELPAWRRDLFWNIPAGTRDVKQKDGSIVKATRFVSIPKPFELGVIFGTAPERALTWIHEKDPHALDGFAETVIGAGTPSIIPNAAVWWLEAEMNKNLRTGAPIVPESETGLEPWRQYGPQTSETAKLVGRAVNVSPRVVDNTIREVLGGLGKYGVELADVGLVATGIAKPPPKPARTLSQTPIAKAFVTEPPDTSSVSLDRFYREVDALESKYQTSKKGGQKLRREEGTRLSRLRDYRQALSDFRQLRSQVESSLKMTPQQKRAEIDRINLAMTNLARKALGEEQIK